MYTYSFFGRHIALVYGAVALIILAPLPFWVEFLFGYKAQHNNAVIIFAGVGIIMALYSIWSDFHDRLFFTPIEISGDGIKAKQKDGEKFILWTNIARLERLKYTDIETKLAWGIKGVRIVDKNDQKIFVFSTIQDYWGLLKLIEEETKKSFQ